MSKIEVNTVAPQCGTTLTLGESGDTVTLGAGASQSGFGRTGAVDWQTTPKTSTFTAANGEGYFINQSSAITMNLPAGSAGAIVAVSDYARNFATYNLTISPNGSEKIGGVAQDATLSVNGQAATLVYVDSTKGWVNVQNAEDTFTSIPETLIAATGGTITTVCTNYKVHTFTGPGTFALTAGSGSIAKVDYMVIAGGGGGGSFSPNNNGSGGGAGGFRESKSAPVSGCWSASPLVAACASLGPFSAPVSIPVTVGAGGANGGGANTSGNKGSDSVFSTITSTGGGFGNGNPLCRTGGPGGSGGGGGGGAFNISGGTGNTPPVSPPQGQNGGATSPGGAPDQGGGGGGGAGAVGVQGTPGSGGGGAGGAGVTSSINGTPTQRAGGGGTGNGAGGAGGGGGGGACGAATAGTANTGGGGGGNYGSANGGGAGGSGIVIIRYKFQ